MKHRIFVAIAISPELQSEILAWEEKRRKLPVRWISGKNLHITLIPPWYEEDVERIKTRLRTITGTVEPFAIRLERVGFGPDPRSPRLIWTEGQTPPALIKLKSEIEITFGITPEKRPFRLHLTLARFRPEDLYSPKNSSERVYSLIFPRKNERVNWQDAINTFVLMESHLSRQGADYEILEKIPL